MIESPLANTPLFQFGPVPITRPVVTTWAIMALMTLGSLALTRRLRLQPGTWQAALELVVSTIEQQIGETMHRPGRRFTPLLGTLFLYLVLANFSSVVPGVQPPTAHIETAGALAAIVFFAVHFYGIQSRGLLGYLASFAKPTIIMLPLNVIAEITRTFSLMVRLFGNVLSGEFVVATVVALAGLLVPIPLMALEVLIGLIQAYIFTVLATVFIGAGIGSVEGG